MARENLWLVKCTDRDGDDVDGLREEHMAGHLAHIEAIVDHIAMAGPLKDPAGERCTVVDEHDKVHRHVTCPCSLSA